MFKYKILTVLMIIFGFSGQIAATNLAYEFQETPLGFYQTHCQPRSIFGGRNITLPSSFYLPNIPPAKDQGPLGTCASFAAGGCVEFYHQKPVSEAEFTVLAEELLPDGDCHPGLNLGNALHLTQQMGFVEQSRFSYDKYLQIVAIQNGIDPRYTGWIDRLGAKKQETIRICERFPSLTPMDDYNQTMKDMSVDIQLYGNRNDVTRYRVGVLDPIHHVSVAGLGQALSNPSTIRRTAPQDGSIGIATRANLKGVKVALYRGCPVATALSVFDDCWNPSKANGFQIQLPYRGNKYNGSHAVMLVGFDDAAECFVLKNSWGTRWGIKGQALIPYDYISKYATELVAVGSVRN